MHIIRSSNCFTVTSGIVFFVGVLFKFGFRFSVVWVASSLVGGLFVSSFCIRQSDLKSLIVYSSVAHISAVIGGIIKHRTVTYREYCTRCCINAI